MIGWCISHGNSLISCKCEKIRKKKRIWFLDLPMRLGTGLCQQPVLRLLSISIVPPTSLHSNNNTSAIQIVSNPILHEHTKHIEENCPKFKANLKISP